MQHNIILVAKREDPFARVPKTVLDDERLSWKAKGILAYLLGKPTGWKVRLADLENKSTDGRDSVRAGLKELRRLGYSELTRITEKGKVRSWVWKVSDSCIFKPEAGFPDVEKPDVEKPPLSKNEPSKNELTKNQSEGTKETSPAADVVFSPTWKPDSRSKEEQLEAISVPKLYPSQREFNAFCETEFVDYVFDSYRPDLYGDLCRSKWHQWKPKANRWVRIQDWRKYVSALAEHIEAAKP